MKLKNKENVFYVVKNAFLVIVGGNLQNNVVLKTVFIALIAQDVFSVNQVFMWKIMNAMIVKLIIVMNAMKIFLVL